MDIVIEGWHGYKPTDTHQYVLGSEHPALAAADPHSHLAPVSAPTTAPTWTSTS